MKPQLGDTVNNRYVLVSSLREADGIQAWKANDYLLSRDCQVFIVNNAKALDSVFALASSKALTQNDHFTHVLQVHRDEGAIVVVTRLDAGLSLSDYFEDGSRRPLSFEAMRSIMSETLQCARILLDEGLTHHAITTDTVRVTRSGVQLADTPISPLLLDHTHAEETSNEGQYIIRQLAALLYAMLTRKPSYAIGDFDLEQLDDTVPMDLRVICRRGLALPDSNDDSIVSLATLDELDALLGQFTPVKELGAADIDTPSIDGECSIIEAALAPVSADDVNDYPDGIVTSERVPVMDFQSPYGMAAMTSPIATANIESSAAAGDAAANKLKSIWAESKQVWSQENLNGAGETGQFSFPLTPTDPDVSSTDDPSFAESTHRLPVIATDGSIIEPGTASQRELNEDRMAQEAAASSFTRNTPIPPSFEPQATRAVAQQEQEEQVSDARLLGNLKTKVVAIIVMVVVVAIALALALHSLSQPANDGTYKIDESESAWPQMNLDEVPFGDGTASSSDTADSADSTSTDASDGTATATDSSDSADSTDSTKKDSKSDATKVVTADKNAKAVPDPKRPENTVAFQIDNRTFLQSPAGQSGLGYYMHLAQSEKPYRMVIKIRSSGGQGYIRVNTTNDPTQGEQVAQFTFDESGTTEIKFDKVVETQDVMLWVPMDSLPGNQLYIDSVEIF